MNTGSVIDFMPQFWQSKRLLKMKFANGRTQPALEPQHSAGSSAASAALQQSPLLQQQATQLMAIRQGKQQQLQRRHLGGIVSQRMNLSDNITQLKRLSSGKLNVVGENHPESGRRRISEEVVSKRETDGGYWTEGEYRKGVDTRNLLSWIFTSDKRDRGDSSELLVEMNAATLADLADIWVNKATNYGSLTIDQKSEMRGAMPALYRFGNDAEVHNSRIQDDTKKKDNLVADVKILLTIVKAIAGGRDITTYSNLPTAISGVRGHLGGRSRAQISTERTSHMQTAAAFDAAKPGVWKVGQNHIDEWPVKSGPYEVLTRDEFNTEYGSELTDD
ncbi:hypothetical protein M2404_002468 [Rheinheimera pacifica]|uniref:hypothetical protein n=1 Tax=Rheinheimera pacifica TaxID=173990 RepID=UPI0021694B59|nr:hypothetical protein [Rheinheimera pacifica]MCS4308120.1 hypothetical protein [Rheinheimera pacifica]